MIVDRLRGEPPVARGVAHRAVGVHLTTPKGAGGPLTLAD